MPLRFLRRTRHYSDGLIIGNKAFVQEAACRFFERKQVLKKQFSSGRNGIWAIIALLSVASKRALAI